MSKSSSTTRTVSPDPAAPPPSASVGVIGSGGPVPGFPQPPGGGRRVLGAEDRAAGDEDRGAGGGDDRGGPLVDPAVHLDRQVEAERADLVSGPADLRDDL